MKIKEKIDLVIGILAGLALDDPRREARLLVKYATGLDEARQITHPDQILTPPQIQAVDMMAARRAAGEPLSRILGRREFYGLEFELSPATLDPRFETELLVDLALDFLQSRADPVSILDLGTGTGCIPIALLTQQPRLRAVAVDISPDALAVTATNARTHGVIDRLALVQSDWFSALSNVMFDLVISNPPYIPIGDIAGLQIEVQGFDPHLALAGGVDGLDPYRVIFGHLARYLKPGGRGLFEIGMGQRDEIAQIAMQSGLDVTGIWNDDAGVPRVVGVTVATC